MIYRCVLVLKLLSLVAGSPIVVEESIEENGDESYDGPLAPLNPDGSVAFTEEYERIRDQHLAAHEREYQRMRADLDEVENDSAPDQSSNVHIEAEGHYDPEIYERVPYISAEEDDGQYDPVVHEEKYYAQYDDGKYRPRYFTQKQTSNEQQSDSPSSEDASEPSYEPTEK